MICVKEYQPFLIKACWPIIWEMLSNGGPMRTLLISESMMRQKLKCSSKSQMMALLEEARRRGVIAYDNSNGAFVIRLLMGLRAVEQFEEYMKRPQGDANTAKGG